MICIVEGTETAGAWWYTCYLQRTCVEKVGCCARAMSLSGLCVMCVAAC